MDNIKDYEEKLASYSKTITSAKKTCDQADKDLLVAETQLKQYQEQRKQIEDECQAVVGVPIDQVDALLTTTMESLEKITSFISSNITGTSQITEASVETMTNFMNANGIDLSESAF